MNGWIEAFIPFFATAREASPGNVIPSVWIAIELLFALCAAAWLWRRSGAVRNSFRSMKVELENLVEAGLSAQYEQVSGRLRSEKTTGSEWSRFEETVHREPLPEGGVCLHRTVDAQDAFDEGVVTRHLNVRYYNAVPGLLTSLGHLGLK